MAIPEQFRVDADYANPVKSMGHTPKWFCPQCGKWERLQSRRALAPLAKKHGYAWAKIPDDGDCFYGSIVRALPPDRVATVERLRAVVAAAFGPDQLECYRLLASVADEADADGDEATAAEYDWARGVRDAGALESLPRVRAYIQRTGAANAGDCVWADQHAIATVGDWLGATILFVDMDRAPDVSPYRCLHMSRGDGRGDDDGYVVLRRQRDHYQPLVERTSGRGFWPTTEALPPVVRALWNLR